MAVLWDAGVGGAEPRSTASVKVEGSEGAVVRWVLVLIVVTGNLSLRRLCPILTLLKKE